MSMASQPKNPAEWRLGVVISAEAVKWWVEELSHGGSKRSGWKPFHVAIISTPSMIENKCTQIPWEWDLLVGGDWNMTFIFPWAGIVIIPIDELILFRGVGIPPTRDIFCSTPRKIECIEMKFYIVARQWSEPDGDVWREGEREIERFPLFFLL